MEEKIKDIILRTVKTMCQTAVGLIGANAIMLTDVNWLMVLSGTVLSGIVCILMNIANETN